MPVNTWKPEPSQRAAPAFGIEGPKNFPHELAEKPCDVSASIYYTKLLTIIIRNEIYTFVDYVLYVPSGSYMQSRTIRTHIAEYNQHQTNNKSNLKHL